MNERDDHLAKADELLRQAEQLREAARLDGLARMAERFRAWTRTEQGAATCLGVAEGSRDLEDDLIAAFVWAVEPTMGDHRVA